MQGAKVFIDTNVLLYMHDRRDESKAEKAWDWLRKLALAEAARLNRQVLNEATHVLLRKKWYASPAIVYAIIDNFAGGIACSSLRRSNWDVHISSPRICRTARISRAMGARA